MRNVFQLIIGNNNNQSITVLPNNVLTNSHDIYFTYGDSDFQSTHCNDKYYDLMHNAFRLLLIFKPATSRIAISASSLLTSQLTSRMAYNYKSLSNCENPHFYVLRKESSWKDYFEKRSHNTKKLRHIDKYRLLLDREAVTRLNAFATLKKDINTGIDTSEKWVINANKILPKIIKQPRMSFDISSLPEEILYDSIFVWEAIEEKLYQRGILVPSWDKQLQNALLESYFNSYSNNFFFPIHDFFTIKNYNKEESLPYYLNINLLNSIIVSCQQSALLDRVSPAGLLKLIYLDEFLTYKSLLEASLTESTCITTAVKHRKLLEKAIQYAGS